MLAEASVFGSNELVGQYYLWGNYIDEALLKVDTHGTVAAADDDDHYYLHDHLYSTVAVLDDAGNVEERYEYNAYGKATIYDANFTERTETAIGNDYLFTGRRYDAETGNHYYRNRYYSQDLGRFLQKDPLGIAPNTFMGNQNFAPKSQYTDGGNLYQYVSSKPLIYNDAIGTMSIGSKISWWIYSRMLTGPLINRLRNDVIEFDDDLGEMGQFYDIQEQYYKRTVWANRAKLKNKWGVLTFSSTNVRSYWRGDKPYDNNRRAWQFSNTDPFTDLTGFWLSSAHRVSVQGSLKAYCCKDYCKYKDVSSNWAWYDDVDANTLFQRAEDYENELRERDISWDPSLHLLYSLEGLWDLWGDKVLDTDFEVKVNWIDNSTHKRTFTEKRILETL